MHLRFLFAVPLALAAFTAQAAPAGSTAPPATPAAISANAATSANGAADNRAAPPAPAAATPASLPPRPTFDRIVLAKMYAGVIVSEATDDEGHGGKAHGWAICKCGVDALWKVLTDHAPFPEFVPRITGMEVSRRTDHGERTLQTIDASIATVKYSLDFNWSVATRTIEFHLVDDLPHDLKAVKGSWQLWPLEHGDYTLFDYQSEVDTGRSIPGFIRDYLADRGVKDTMDAMRRRAEGLPPNK